MARICMVTQSFYERDPRVRREAEALIEYGHEVDVICLDSIVSRNGLVNGVNTHPICIERKRGGISSYLREYLAFFVAASRHLQSLHSRRHYSIVHVHNMPDFLVLSALPQKLQGVTIFLDVHDPMPELFATQYNLSLTHPAIALLRAQLRMSCAIANKVITVNMPMRSNLATIGIPSHKITVIHNLPDHSVFSRCSKDFAPSEGLKLVYAGTVSYRHGLDIAIRAISQLRPELPCVTLTIVGDGPETGRLTVLAKELGIEDMVRILPPVPLDDIPGVLAEADVGLSTQRCNPFGDLCFPTKLLEYFAAGLPVIAARTPGVTSYLDEKTVFFFEPGDATSLARQILLVSRDRQAVIARLQGRESFIARYQWGKERQLLIDLVHSCLIKGEKR